MVDLEQLLDELAESSIESADWRRVSEGPVYTEDVDVVYSLSDDNVARAERWLTSIDARFVPAFGATL